MVVAGAMNIVFILLWFIPLYFISALIHELGHIVVQLRYGWKLHLLVVGLIGIRRNDADRLTLYFEKNPSMWGGAMFAFPTKESENNIKVFSKSLLGGPIASIILGVISLLSAIIFFYETHQLLTLGLMSIVMGVVCFLPLKDTFTYTDGKRWRRIRDGGQGKAEEIALFKIVEHGQLKNKNETLQKEDFEVLLTAKLSSHRYYGYYYLYLYYASKNDNENKEMALNVLQSMKKDVPKMIVDECKID